MSDTVKLCWQTSAKRRRDFQAALIALGIGQSEALDAFADALISKRTTGGKLGLEISARAKKGSRNAR